MNKETAIDTYKRIFGLCHKCGKKRGFHFDKPEYAFLHDNPLKLCVTCYANKYITTNKDAMIERAKERARTVGIPEEDI